MCSCGSDTTKYILFLEKKNISPSPKITANHIHNQSSMADNTEFEKTDPSKFLSGIIGSSVCVKLHNGVEYKGNLQTIDGFMNVVLDEGKETVNGKVTKKYGDVFIRGNNGMYKENYWDINSVLLTFRF